MYLRGEVVLEEAVKGSHVVDRLKEAVFAGQVARLDKVVLERRAHGTALEADARVRGGIRGGSKQNGGCCDRCRLDDL